MKVVLARVRRSPLEKVSNATGLRPASTGCACAPLAKAARRKKKRGSPEYLKWLEKALKPLAKDLHKFLKAEAVRVAKWLSSEIHHEKLRKAELPHIKVSVADVERILKQLDLSGWVALIGVIEPELLSAFKENAKAGFQVIGFDPSEEIVNLVNEQASTWAAERAAGLVGMRRNPDGTLVENPNAAYAITETTRDELRGLTADAIDEGWSVDTFTSELLDSFAFSEERATTIARTELAFAHVEGNLTAWDESGVVEQKQSILCSEHDLDDTCNDNADEGPIPLDAEFQSGHQGPPYHPNCVCDVVPVLSEQ